MIQTDGVSKMNVSPIDESAASERVPAIFGRSHELLAEVARRAAHQAADEHVRAGRLASACPAEEPGTTQPADRGKS
jgi:hypothetical protein